MSQIEETQELSEILGIASQRLREWEEEVEASKQTVPQYVATVGWKGMAALTQYKATLKIARLGAELLMRTMEDRKEGLLFGLTKRPMFESYTRGIWFENVADEKLAEGYLRRSKRDEEKQWKTLNSEGHVPDLTRMWAAIRKRKILDDMVSWMNNKKDWWNDSTHLNARSVWMGWSDEYGKTIQNDEAVRNDLLALLEVGAQCAAHIHTINEGVEGLKAQRVYEEKAQLRERLGR